MDKIVCVGKNYLAHAKELGDQVPEKPVLFLKPPSVLRQAKAIGDRIEVPLVRERGEVHHECEIVVKLSSMDPLSIESVTLGLDMTLRDVQTQLKKSGHPWTVAKVFPESALLGSWLSIKEFPKYLEVPFELRVNGEVRQRGVGQDMLFSVPRLLVYVQEFFPLCPGDMIFTGTPAGVGSVHVGDLAELAWGDKKMFQVRWV